MTNFTRKITDITALKSKWDAQDGILCKIKKHIVDNGDTLLTFRDEQATVYYNGNQLCNMTFPDFEPTISELFLPLLRSNILENRRSKKLLLSNTSLVMVAFNIVMCFAFSDEPIAVFALSIYMMTMSVATGRWAKELSYPYIYLIPESSFKKLLYTLKSDIPSIIAESILCIVPMYFICYLTVTDLVGMILARISFGLLIISVNLFVQKIFGVSDKKKLIVFIYFILIMLFSIPGIITAFAVGLATPFYIGFAFMAMAVTNTALSLILTLFNKKLLEEI